MDISRFFIDRPHFAAVLSIFIFMIGAMSIFRLPVSEYPEVAPPQIVVRAQYPGANPRVISCDFQRDFGLQFADPVTRLGRDMVEASSHKRKCTKRPRHARLGRSVWLDGGAGHRA